ncbi:periplasmic cell division protein (SufI) [Sulfuriferula plumbiphila]|uniref:Periplasmic cell division protein (SufI) n=1 Tax=Sulfuriferula plumbiphila TaxID=171865 RepID=A0A512L980_9PROT|nr:multicopper oxidase family protein [Sulfuriferula plumbiphila]BBP03023.1 periplasmic cell division protein (SufI) [Sulfuriferula plumbiphila]GEP31055.1 periplasmic cell division protein (SufI) [Sulfuriferula plumbiphila]
MQRRKFLQYAAASGLGILGGGYLYQYATNTRQNNFLGSAAARNMADSTPLFIPGDSGPLGVLDMTDAPMTLNARAATLPLIQGKPSPFLIYNAQYANQTYQNPIIRIQRGSQFNARLQNDLNEPTIIHWHGLHVPGAMDGHPRTTIAAGAHYDYTFPVTNRGGMYWYHTHAHNLTAKQAYFGLAGLFMVEDEDEAALRNTLQLAPGVTELPLLIQDKQFNSAGKLTYADNPMQQMMGQLGDTILVNLTPQPQLDIANRLYRLRILNGSNSRIYKLAFIHRGKMLPYAIIGTDAGLLERPYTAQEVFLAPAERVDILFDASQLRAGEEVLLKSLAFDAMQGGMMPGMGGMMGGMSGMGGMGGASLALGAEFEIMKLAVTRQGPATPSVPPRQLSTIARIDTRGAAVRNISLTMQRMRWLINGESFNMDSYPIQSRSNTVELWDIQNAKMSMPHPMHMHGFSFQVVSRQNSPGQVRKLAQDASGRLITDLGWKDTILVWPGETVRIAIDFTNEFKGDQLYLFHCHNLEHEDQGMMVNHRVTAV